MHSSSCCGRCLCLLPLPGACAGLAWFDAGHDADAVIVTYTLTSSTWHSGASFICLDAFVCRQVSTHPDAVGDRAGQGRTLVQPSRAGCKPRYICTVHGLYGTDWSFPGQGRFGPVCLCPGVGCSCSSLAVTTRHPVVCAHVHRMGQTIVDLGTWQQHRTGHGAIPMQAVRTLHTHLHIAYILWPRVMEV